MQCASSTTSEGVGSCLHGLFIRPSPEFSVRDVENERVSCSKAGTSARLTPELSVRVVNGSVGLLSSPVFRIFGVLDVGFICRAAAATQVLFEDDALLSP